MTDSRTRDTEGVPTTSFLPDHLVAGDPAGIEAAATNESATDEGDDGDDDPATEFCRSWRSHLSGGRGGSPF
jgi:hypothetical protein